MSKLVQGVGINDADYLIYPMVNGKKVMCPFYQTWGNMLIRCYSPAEKKRHPTYTGCSVCPEWHSFMAFKAWMLTQDWQGKQLDKDLLIPGNKRYSPETCAFVDKVTNTFTNELLVKRGELPIGVTWDAQSRQFKARCRNPYTKKRETLGKFPTTSSGYEAWKTRKHQLSCQLAEQQSDKRVAEALRTRYL